MYNPIDAAKQAVTALFSMTQSILRNTCTLVFRGLTLLITQTHMKITPGEAWPFHSDLLSSQFHRSLLLELYHAVDLRSLLRRDCGCSDNAALICCYSKITWMTSVFISAVHVHMLSCLMIAAEMITPILSETMWIWLAAALNSGSSV